VKRKIHDPTMDINPMSTSETFELPEASQAHYSHRKNPCMREALLVTAPNGDLDMQSHFNLDGVSIAAAA